MRIINTSAVPITNFEVYGVLKEEILDLEARAEAFRKDSVGSRDDATAIQRETSSARHTVDYLERCYPLVVRTDQRAVSQLLRELSKFPLTDGEVLQLINLAPSDPVFFHGFCRECEERFTDEQIDRLCDLVTRHLLRNEWTPVADVPSHEQDTTAADVGAPAEAHVSTAEGSPSHEASEVVRKVRVVGSGTMAGAGGASSAVTATVGHEGHGPTLGAPDVRSDTKEPASKKVRTASPDREREEPVSVPKAKAPPGPGNDEPERRESEEHEQRTPDRKAVRENEAAPGKTSTGAAAGRGRGGGTRGRGRDEKRASRGRAGRGERPSPQATSRLKKRGTADGAREPVSEEKRLQIREELSRS